MAILWCGGEDLDFPNGFPNVTTYTGGGFFRAGYSRGTLCSNVNDSSSIFTSNPISSITTPIWLSVQAGMRADTSYLFAGYCTGLTDLTGQGIFVRKGTTGKVELVKRQGTTNTILATETGNLFSDYSGVKKVDLYISSYDAATQVQVYVGATDTPCIDYTGDITIPGVPMLNCVSAGGGSYVYSSEFIVATQDTRLMSVVTLPPNAAGDLNEWNGTYANIDDNSRSDADTVYTDQVDKTFECNLSGLPLGNFVVKGVKVAARAVDGVGGLALQLGIKTNGTVDLGTPVTLGSTWKLLEQVYAPNNPTTNQPFTVSEIEALQLALKTVAAV